MRKLICALALVMMAALCASGQPAVGLQISVQNAMQQPQSNRVVNVAYGTAPSVQGSAIVLSDLIQLTTDTNGNCYVTNAVAGYYAVTVQAPPTTTPFMVYLTNTLTNLVNATNYLVAPTNLTYTRRLHRRPGGRGRHSLLFLEH